MFTHEEPRVVRYESMTEKGKERYLISSVLLDVVVAELVSPCCRPVSPRRRSPCRPGMILLAP